MAFDFRFPDLGEGIQEGEIVKWFVKEGDTVKENQKIVQIETDKAVTDVPSPKSGKILKIGAKNGETVKVGELLCTIGTGGEKALSPAKSRKSVAVVGQLEEASGKGVEYKTQASTMRGELQSKKVLVSPAVRKFASDHGINLAKIKGSGKDGVLLKNDLPLSSSIPQQTISVRKEETNHGKIERIQLKGIRKTISDNMIISHQIPHVTSMEDIDITRIWGIKEREKKKIKEFDLTLLPFIVKASIAVLKENPYFNGTLDLEENEILIKKYYNIGIAVETPVGLMVPVLKDADKKTIEQIGMEIKQLAQKARDRKISIEEMKGSTFTITNYGSIGGNYSTPLINPGESAVLGIGRAFDILNPEKPQQKIKILPVSLTFDHRMIDGAQAARFLESLKEYLQDPNHLFIEL